MSIHNEAVSEISGFDKEIEASALGMIFDNLQMYQYQYPERSTVRELVSNALDSTKEKFIAMEILYGGKKEDEYYLHREDAVYKDSNFDPTYYDLRYLSPEKRVFVNYHEGQESARDTIEILDYGVGLGGKRLQGYFKLGYSSKRNTKFALGKFGIGAKSALSTGVDCYYVETQYNGLRTKWNVYSAKVNSLVPPFNTETGQPNIELDFGSGKIYAEDHGLNIEGKAFYNYTKLVIQVKKHKKQAYIDAVKTQLMYFSDVVLTTYDAEGNSQIIPTKANILYEDETLVVASNTVYTKPHIILNGVNYGLIDFKELELEDKQGNVGVKVPAEGVQVNPSRESVIWNDKTRETILKCFDAAVNSASSLVNTRLETTDYLEWHRTIGGVRSRLYANEQAIDPLSILSKIVDIEKMQFAFKPDPRLGTRERANWGVPMYEYSLMTKSEKVGKKTVKKTSLNRFLTTHMSDKVLEPTTVITYTEAESMSIHVRTIRYLLSNPDVKAVVVYIKRPSKESPVEAPIYSTMGFVNDILAEPKKGILGMIEKAPYAHLKKFLDMKNPILSISQIQESFLHQWKTSASVRTLEEVEVPEDFKFQMTMVDGQLVEEEVISEEQDKPPVLTPEQLRRQEGRIYLRTPQYGGSKGIAYTGVEPNLLEVDNWNAEYGNYYATQENQEQLSIATLISMSAVKSRMWEDNKAWSDNNGVTDVNKTVLNKTAYGVMSYWASPNSLDKVERNVLEESLTPSEKASWKKMASDFRDSAVHYFSPSVDGSNREMTFKNPPLRLVLVSKDLERKLPDNVRPIQEFFLSFTPNKEITMSNILANWYLASTVKDVVVKSRKFTDSRYYHNHRIKLITGQLSVFVEKYASTDLFNLLKSENNWKEQLTGFMEKVLEFQQFVSLHASEPILIAARANHLFGTPEITGSVAFDMGIYNKIAELKEYWNQAGHFFHIIDWKTITEEQEQLIQEISQFKGWEPWEFEPPYPEAITKETFEGPQVDPEDYDI